MVALYRLLEVDGSDLNSDLLENIQSRAGRMARAETRLRRKGGLPAGLIGRTKKPVGSRRER